MMRECFHTKQIIKEYVGISKGVPSPLEGEIDVALAEKAFMNEQGQKRYKIVPASRLMDRYSSNDNQIKTHRSLTRFKVIDIRNDVALLTMQLNTGLRNGYCWTIYVL
ncbi:hypothetical protein ACOME3_005622 [Neoechinorhynchus agilis]